MLRISSGEFKHRALRVAGGVRPTISKARKVIFDTLQTVKSEFDLCLDCFAGTGALGMEALSRMCKKAIFVEKDQKAYSSLIENVKLMPRDRYELLNKDIFAIGRTWQPCDLILMDPPFYFNHKKTIDSRPHKRDKIKFCEEVIFQSPRVKPKINIDIIPKLLIYLANNNWIANDGNLIIERPKGIVVDTMITESLAFWCQNMKLDCSLLNNFTLIKTKNIAAIDLLFLRFNV